LYSTKHIKEHKGLMSNNNKNKNNNSNTNRSEDPPPLQQNSSSLLYEAIVEEEAGDRSSSSSIPYLMQSPPRDVSGIEHANHSSSNSSNTSSSSSSERSRDDNKNKDTVMGDEVLHDSSNMLHLPVDNPTGQQDDEDDTVADTQDAEEFVKRLAAAAVAPKSHPPTKLKQGTVGSSGGGGAAFRVSRISDVTTDGRGSGLFPTPKTLNANGKILHGNGHGIHGAAAARRFPRPSGRGILGQRLQQSLRNSRLSRSISVAVSHASQKVSEIEQQAEQYMDPTKTARHTFASHALYLFGFLQLAALVALISTRRYPTLLATIPMAALGLLATYWTVHFTESTTRGERFFTVVGCLVVLLASTSSMYAATSPCAHCVYYWAHDTMSSSSTAMSGGGGGGGGGGLFHHGGRHDRSSGSVSSTSPSSRLSVLWDLLTSPAAADPYSLTGSCRPCVSTVVRVMDHLFPQQDSWDDDALEAQEKGLFNISNYQTSKSLFGDLASWYLYHHNATRPKYLERFNRKIAGALSNEGHLNDDAMAEALTEFLCSPASRFDNPDPNRYLADLKRPRFTGEPELNISASALQSIMRGDPLRKMGVPVCFMLRFALMVPKDYELENKPIQITTIKPSMNEQGMRSKDWSDGLPFLITPGRDQDIDYESTEMDRFGAIMDIFGKNERTMHEIAWIFFQHSYNRPLLQSAYRLKRTFTFLIPNRSTTPFIAGNSKEPFKTNSTFHLGTTTRNEPVKWPTFGPSEPRYRPISWPCTIPTRTRPWATAVSTAPVSAF
jgi:hypothetical protein